MVDTIKRFTRIKQRHRTKVYTDELENVATNDVLPLKAARRDAIANGEMFWGPWTPET